MTTSYLRKSIGPATAGRSYLLIGVALACFGLSPAAQAVLPAPTPDGGYAGGNTAEGLGSLSGGVTPAPTGHYNTADGFSALNHLTSGIWNTALGAQALFTNASGSNNTAVGLNALYYNTASDNTAVGTEALKSNTNSDENTAVGSYALYNNMSGLGANTAIGYEALLNNNVGTGNTAIGFEALANNTANLNTAIGVNAGSNVATASNVICIGAAGTNTSNACFIGQIYSNVQPIVGHDPDSVTINSNGRLGRGGVSSRRYKHDIQPMDKASEVLFGLKPVSFRYNKEYDATQTLAFGLIAEDVAEVDPDLVGRNPQGQPESVRYEQINAMLLNEFLKEHRKVEQQSRKMKEQDTTITQLKSGMEALTATVKRQASQIQKVSAQLELSKPAPQTVRNNQ